MLAHNEEFGFRWLGGGTYIGMHGMCFVRL